MSPIKKLKSCENKYFFKSISCYKKLFILHGNNDSKHLIKGELKNLKTLIFVFLCEDYDNFLNKSILFVLSNFKLDL